MWKVEKKQLVLLGLVVLAFGFLGYQVYKLVRSDVSLTPSEMGAPHVKSQKQFVEITNQYQLAKKKRQLLEEQTSIAEAQQRVAEIRLKTHRLQGVSLNSPGAFGITAIDFKKNNINPQSLQRKYCSISNFHPHALFSQRKIKISKLKKMKLKKTNGFRSNQAILKRSSKHFTIQLVESHNLAAINQFVKVNSLKSAMVLRFNHHRNNWYVLIDGNYSSSIKAKHALQKLPKTLKTWHAWVRSYASLQKLVG